MFTTSQSTTAAEAEWPPWDGVSPVVTKQLNQVGDFKPVEAKSARDGTWLFTATKPGEKARGKWLLRLFRPGRVRRRAAERALPRLNEAEHPNLLGYDSTGQVNQGVYSDTLWIARPVRRQSLARRCNRSPLSASEALHCAIAAAQGLAYLHERQLVHLSLMPRNIFWYRGQWQLADYGYQAWMPSRLSADFGDTYFQAPELREGQTDPSADIYALGAILAWLASELRPGAKSASPTDSSHSWPVGWADLLWSCLDPSPQHRPNAASIAYHLRDLSTDDPTPSLSEFDKLVVSREFRETVLRGVSRRIDRKLKPRELEQVTDEAVTRLWARTRDDSAFLRSFSDLNRFIDYAITDVVNWWDATHRESWRGRVALDPIATEIVGSSRLSVGSRSGAIEAISDIEERIGSRFAQICRQRIVGKSYTQIANNLTTTSVRWRAHDVFVSLYRLRRAYPEIDAILPTDDPVEAAEIFATWFTEQGHEYAVPLASMHLAGYQLRQIAEEVGSSTASVSSRLYRLSCADPWIGPLLEPPASKGSSEIEQAHALLAGVKAGRMGTLDDPWLAWLETRAARVFEDAVASQSADAAEQAARQLTGDFSIVQEICLKVAGERSLTEREVRQLYDGESLVGFNEQLEKGRVLAFGGQQRPFFPAFQFGPQGLVDVVAEINGVLGAGEDPYGVFFWWTEPNGRLSARAPVELLESDLAEELRILVELAEATVSAD